MESRAGGNQNRYGRVQLVAWAVAFVFNVLALLAMLVPGGFSRTAPLLLVGGFCCLGVILYATRKQLAGHERPAGLVWVVSWQGVATYTLLTPCLFAGVLLAFGFGTMPALVVALSTAAGGVVGVLMARRALRG